MHVIARNYTAFQVDEAKLRKLPSRSTLKRIMPYLSGDKEIPLPDGLKIWFGPYGNAEYRANRA